MQILAFSEVQAVPVALTPLEQVQVFWLHTRLDDEVQAVVSLKPVPAPHAARHAVHALAVL